MISLYKTSNCIQKLLSNPENELKESISRAQLVMKMPDSNPELCGASKGSSIVYSTTICKFFNRASGCKYGEKCRYRHELKRAKPGRNGNVDAETQPVPKGDLGEKLPGNRVRINGVQCATCTSFWLKLGKLHIAFFKRCAKNFIAKLFSFIN